MYYAYRLWKEYKTKPASDGNNNESGNEGTKLNKSKVSDSEKEKNATEGDSIFACILLILEKMWNWSVLIAMSILTSVLPFKLIYVAFVITIFLGLVVLVVEYFKYKGGKIRVFPKYLDVGLPLINIGLLIFVLTYPPPSSWHYKYYMGAVINACLCVFGVVTIALGEPFTIQYGKEMVSEVMWHKESFRKINLRVTQAWCLAWALTFAFDMAYSEDTGEDPSSMHKAVGGSVPLVVLFLAIKFTGWYPKHERERITRAAQQGKERDQDTDGAGDSVRPVSVAINSGSVPPTSSDPPSKEQSGNLNMSLLNSDTLKSTNTEDGGGIRASASAAYAPAKEAELVKGDNAV